MLVFTSVLDGTLVPSKMSHLEPFRTRQIGRLMTTATSRFLLGPAVAAAVVGVVLVIAGALAAGSTAALAAAVGSVAVTVVFAFGNLTVGVVARLMPSLSLVFALMTYALQLAAVTAVFAGLARSGALDESLDRTWLAAGVIAATLAWTLAQVVVNMRARVLLYDLPSQGAEASVR